MNLSEVFTAKAIAVRFTEDASNKVPYLGVGFFPGKTKMGLDLKWIKGHKGLPVSLKPSNFDAQAELRTREGFKIDETEMAFFREQMLVKEADRQEIMRVQDSADPYAAEVLNRIYDDTNNLVEGADVVPERMRMQLLSAQNSGHPGITIGNGDVQYTYNYDVDNSYATNNYMAISTAADKWNVAATCDPLKDIETGLDAVENLTGVRPTMALMNLATFNNIKKATSIKNAILAKNTMASVYITSELVKALFRDTLGIEIIVYTKKYKDESGTAHDFYPSGYCTLLPEGALGTTWYGTTPEQADLMGDPGANVAIVHDGVAVSVYTNKHPVNVVTTVSEICLPSYERMDETYVIKAY